MWGFGEHLPIPLPLMVPSFDRSTFCSFRETDASLTYPGFLLKPVKSVFEREPRDKGTFSNQGCGKDVIPIFMSRESVGTILAEVKQTGCQMPKPRFNIKFCSHPGTLCLAAILQRRSPSSFSLTRRAWSRCKDEDISALWTSHSDAQPNLNRQAKHMQKDGGINPS